MLKINPASGEAEEITLFDLMDGAVKERAGLVLKQVLENIRDLNTDPCKARTLTVKFTFAADDQREDIQVKTTIDKKLVPIKDVTTKIILGSQNGELVAVEQPKAIPGQLNMSGREQEDAKVIDMGAKRA